MKVVYSPQHQLHNPETEVQFGIPIPIYEIPARAETIHRTLLRDGGFESQEPTEHGIDPITAVHDPDLVRYLEEAWRDWRKVLQQAPAVIPDTVLHPALREGMGPAREPGGPTGRIGYWCWETMTPLVPGTYRTVYLVRAITDPNMTTNDGFMRAVDIVCPRGSVLNPNPPAAVSVRHNTCQRLADTLVRAASSIWPEKAVGSGTVTFFDINMESVSPKTGRESVMMDVVGGGTGGHRHDDGLDGVDTYMSNVGLLPVEVAETEYAVRIVRTELVEGSQGLGAQNGGLGLRREYLVLDRPQTATIYGEQTDPRFRPRGVLGGTDGAPTRITILSPSGEPIDAPSKVTLTLEPGTLVRVETSGGGGYGDGTGRDPQARRSDLEDGRLPPDTS